MEKGSHSSHLNPRRIYLFNDIILYTRLDQSRELVQGVLYLKSLRVEETPENELFVLHDESGSGKSWDFKPDKMMLTRWIKDLRKYIKLSKEHSDNEIDCVSMSNNSHHMKVYGSIYRRDEYGRTDSKPRLLTRKDRMMRRRSTFFGLVSSPFHSSSQKHFNESYK